jgi:general secretion pathway protein G
MPSKPASGFTLIELMVTLAIVALLGALTVPVLQVAAQRSKEEQLRHALREIRDAIDAYKKAGDEGEIDIPAEASGYPPNLDLLVEGVTRKETRKKGKLYFLRRVPRDPMDERLEVSASATWGKRSFASEAKDPAEGDDVFDVYSLSSKNGLNGTPYSAW